jgi:glycosyltransferase involved in cell wall biosynthesis
MKVLHVIGSLESGGAERTLERLVRASTASFVHEIITFRAGGWLEHRLREAGVTVRTVPLPGRDLRRGLAGLRMAIAASEADVVHAWMHHSCVLTALAVPAGMPLVWGVRTMAQPWRERATTAAAMFGSAVVSRRASTIVYNSHAAERSHRRIGYPAATGVVIHNGYDSDAFAATAVETAAWRTAQGLSGDTPLMMQVGRFHPVKGHRFLLQVLQDRTVLGTAWHLVLLGRPDGVAEGELLAAAATADLAGRLHIIPESHDVRIPLAAADLVVVPSLWGESFPNAVAEAMASGTTVVAADLGDTRSIVADCGTVVRAGDRAAWADALRRVTRSSDRDALGRAARERIRSEYSLHRFVERYRAVLYQAASRRRGP